MSYFDYLQHRLFYREQGEGPLLLILPGNTASSICHQGELDHFSQHFRAVSLDFLGTGASDRIPVWPEDWWETGADQVEALIAHLGYEDGLLLGTSGGAVIALLAAILYPERVRAVVADSTVERFSPEMLQRNVIEGRSQRSPGQIQFWSFAHGADWEQVIEADTAVLRHLVEHGGNWFGGRLDEIQCPALLTTSLRDEFFPDVSTQVTSMALQIPDCSVFLANQGGHPLMWTRAPLFRQVVDSFLAGL